MADPTNQNLIWGTAWKYAVSLGDNEGRHYFSLLWKKSCENQPWSVLINSLESASLAHNGEEERTGLLGKFWLLSIPGELKQLGSFQLWVICKSFLVNTLPPKYHLDSEGLWIGSNLLRILKIPLQVSAISKRFIWFPPQSHILGTPSSLVGMATPPARLLVCRHLPA